LDDIAIAEQMHNRILSLDQLLADWQRLVKDFIYLQCLDIRSQTALHLQTPSGHTGASTISWWSSDSGHQESEETWIKSCNPRWGLLMLDKVTSLGKVWQNAVILYMIISGCSRFFHAHEVTNRYNKPNANTCTCTVPRRRRTYLTTPADAHNILMSTMKVLSLFVRHLSPSCRLGKRLAARPHSLHDGYTGYYYEAHLSHIVMGARQV